MDGIRVVLSALLLIVGFLGLLTGAVWLLIAALRRKRKSTPGIVAGLGLALFVLAVVVSPDSDTQSIAQGAESASGPTATPKPAGTPAPLATATATPSQAGRVAPMTDDQKEVALLAIMEYQMVRDAAISQDGDRLSLAIVVSYAVNDSYARELGDNFFRLVKTFSEDAAPGKRIGQGTYNYLVTVVRPDSSVIVQGAKSRFAEDMKW